MGDPVPTHLLMGWEVEAISGLTIRCKLKITPSIEHAKRNEFQLIPLSIPPEHCLEIATALCEAVEQFGLRGRPLDAVKSKLGKRFSISSPSSGGVP